MGNEWSVCVWRGLFVLLLAWGADFWLVQMKPHKPIKAYIFSSYCISVIYVFFGVMVALMKAYATTTTGGRIFWYALSLSLFLFSLSRWLCAGRACVIQNAFRQLLTERCGWHFEEGIEVRIEIEYNYHRICEAWLLVYDGKVERHPTAEEIGECLAGVLGYPVEMVHYK